MIKTKRLKIIPLERKYIDRLRKTRLEYNTWHYLTDSHPINDLQQERWFEKLCNDLTKMYFVIGIEKDEISFSGVSSGGIVKYEPEFQFVGILRSDEYDRTNRSIRIGVDIDEQYRGNGYGSEAMEAFVDYLFKHLAIHRIWLLVASENAPAKKLYKKIGFKEEGIQREAIFRDGKWMDYIEMSILEGEWKKNTK